MNFNEYKTKARYACEINEGYSANLNEIKLANCPYMPEDSEVAQAWRHGWNIADSHIKGK